MSFLVGMVVGGGGAGGGGLGSARVGGNGVLSFGVSRGEAFDQV